MDKFYIDSDIKKAETLPAQFYKSQEVFDKLKENVFVKSWQWIGDENTLVPLTESVYPFVLLEYYLTEPLLIVRDKKNTVKCLIMKHHCEDQKNTVQCVIFEIKPCTMCNQNQNTVILIHYTFMRVGPISGSRSPST